MASYLKQILTSQHTWVQMVFVFLQILELSLNELAWCNGANWIVPNANKRRLNKTLKVFDKKYWHLRPLEAFTLTVGYYIDIDYCVVGFRACKEGISLYLTAIVESRLLHIGVWFVKLCIQWFLLGIHFKVKLVSLRVTGGVPRPLVEWPRTPLGNTCRFSLYAWEIAASGHNPVGEMLLREQPSASWISKTDKRLVT